MTTTTLTPTAAAAGATTGGTTTGRTRITSKALNRVVSAVTAEALGVDAAKVGVTLTDDKGELVLAVRSPLRVVALSRVVDDAGVVDRTGGTILDRAARAQEEIRRRVTELTGSSIARVVVRLTGVEILEAKRVS